MSKNEFKDRLFDVLNETNDMPIDDIDTDDKNSNFRICLDDGTEFLIHVDNYCNM